MGADFARTAASIVCAIASTACGHSGVTVEYRGGGYADGGYSFTRAERALIETVAEDAIRDVRQLGSIVAVETRFGGCRLQRDGPIAPMFSPVQQRQRVDGHVKVRCHAQLDHDGLVRNADPRRYDSSSGRRSRACSI